MVDSESQIEYRFERLGPKLTVVIAPREGKGSYSSFVRSDKVKFIAFLREVLYIIEEKLSCKNYHLKVIPNTKVKSMASVFSDLQPYIEKAGFHFFIIGDDDRKNQPQEADSLLDMDTKISYHDGHKQIELPVT